MSQNKIKELFDDYSKSLDRLEEALSEDVEENNIYLDGAIQRFEFTFELAWKLMRAILQYRGIEVNSPRMSIKEGYGEKFFEDGDGWIKMLEDRNLTTHTYKQDLAIEIYGNIKGKYFNLLKLFLNDAKPIVEGIA